MNGQTKSYRIEPLAGPYFKADIPQIRIDYKGLTSFARKMGKRVCDLFAAFAKRPDSIDCLIFFPGNLFRYFKSSILPFPPLQIPGLYWQKSMPARPAGYLSADLRRS